MGKIIRFIYSFNQAGTNELENTRETLSVQAVTIATDTISTKLPSQNIEFTDSFIFSLFFF